VPEETFELSSLHEQGWANYYLEMKWLSYNQVNDNIKRT